MNYEYRKCESEQFSVEANVEKNLKNFADEDVLALEVSINSPAIVMGVSSGNDVTDLMERKLAEEGINQEHINSSFKSLVE